VVQRAWGDMGCGGLKVERETVALEAVLASMIPGNFHLRGRQAAISSRNFAAFASLHNYPMGRRKGRWGDPIAVFRTSGGTPYLFHLHVDGVGNSFISGMTGAGKSVLVGFIVCQAERTGAQILLWDKDRGLEALVRHVGGAYLSLRNTPGLGAGLAPLKRLTDDADDMAFLSGLIRACVSTPAPYEWEPEEERRLGIALRYVMALPPEERSMEEVRCFLGTGRSGAGARLEKWCAGGEFGWIIDCERDIVDLDNMVLGFDQSDLIGDPIAAGAVMATLFHYTGKLVDGRKLLFVLDEVWKALEIAQFQAEIKNGLKTWRKYNSPIIMATQEVSDALNSPIGDTIKGQTPTQIFFSDPKASWKYYGPEGMNLTEAEFEIVKRLPKGTGTFLLRQGDRSCVLTAPLGGLDEVAVISGSADGVKALAVAQTRAPGAVGETLMAEYRKALLEVAE
jgi:type IV secretion system protein VirB4